MAAPRVYEHSVLIRANATEVERCFTEQELMHRWLNPALRCEPVGETWSTKLGSQFRFMLQVPVLRPSLMSTVVEREPGLVVWQFQGFFKGRDRWECQPESNGTRLLNRFEFTIPNPLIRIGFDQFAAGLTQQDMQAQLQRLKQVAERLAS